VEWREGTGGPIWSKLIRLIKMNKTYFSGFLVKILSFKFIFFFDVSYFFDFY